MIFVNKYNIKTICGQAALVLRELLALLTMDRASISPTNLENQMLA